MVERSCAAVSLTSPAGSLPRSHLQESRRGPRDQAAGPPTRAPGSHKHSRHEALQEVPSPLPRGTMPWPDSLPQSTEATGHRVVSLTMPASFHREPQRLARHVSAVAPAPALANPAPAEWVCLLGWGAFPLELIKRNECPSPSCTQLSTTTHFCLRLNSGNPGWAETTWTHRTLDPRRRGPRCPTGTVTCGLNPGELGARVGGRTGAGDQQQGRDSRASPVGQPAPRGSLLTPACAFGSPGNCARDPPTIQRAVW